MEGLTEGRIVHYVIADGEHRPAIVVKNWGETYSDPGTVNLTVFTDWSNDRRFNEQYASGLYWATSVKYSENKEPGSWHWIERA